MRSRIATKAAVAAVLVSLISACSGPESVANEVRRGLPDDMEAGDPEDGPSAVRLTMDTFAVVTWGSSTCPDVVTDVRADERAGDAVSVDLAQSGRSECTADLGPTTHELDVPESRRSSEELTVRIRQADGQVVTRTALPVTPG